MRSIKVSSLALWLVMAIVVLTMTAVRVQAAPGNAAQFTSDSNSFIAASSSTELKTFSALTLEAWIRPNGGREWALIMGKQYNPGDGNPWYSYRICKSNYGTFPDTVNFNIAPVSTGGEAGVTSTTVVQNDIWTHVAGVYDGATMKIYINGTLENTVNQTGDLKASDLPMYIGKAPWTNYNNYNGQMDELRIWNVARTQAQIQYAMNRSLEGNEEGLVAYWPFNDAAGSPTADDASQYDNVGTLYNGATIVADSTAPVNMDLIAQTAMPVSTTIVSNPITVTGISSPAAISITGGEYSVSSDGGTAWTSFSATIPATVSLNNLVKVRQTSSGSYSTLTTATLTIGGVSGVFNVTTAALGDPNNSGLVSWWRGDGNGLDAMGINHANLVGNPAFQNGVVGQAFSFNGTSQYAQMQSSGYLPLGSNPRTVSLWFKTPRNLSSSTESGLFQYGYPALGNMFGLITSVSAPGKLYFYGGGRDLAGTTTIQPDTWYHGAVTYDMTTLRLYLNGRLEADAPLSLNTGEDGNGLTVGNRWNGGAKWEGLIDEVKIYSRALTANEIRSLYDRNLDFEADPAATSGPSISGWNYEFFTMNDSGTRGSNPTADHELATTATRSFSGDKAVSSRIRTLGGVGNQDPDYHYATHLLTTDYLPQTGKMLDAVTIWRSDIAYTTSSRWFYWFAIEMSDGTNTNSVMLACRDWGNQEGCTSDFQDTHDQTSTGTDGQTWYRHRVPVPANLDQSKLKITIRHTERSWDGTSAESSLYYDLLGEETVVIDQTPDPFNFISQTGLSLSTTIVSNPITVTGINSPAAISISVGDYQINGGSWSSSAGTVNNGDTVMVRLTSSGSYSALTTATLTIGGVSGAFNVTTAASGDPNASGLVSWWKAENNGYDSVGGNHGTLQGGTAYDTGRVGQSFSLDGSYSYVSVPNSSSIDYGPTRTFELWIYPKVTAGYRGMLAKGYGSYSHIFSLSDGHLALYDGGAWHTGTAVLSANTWHHVAFVQNGSTVTMYLNGVLDGTANVSWTSTSDFLEIGSFNHSNFNDTFVGLIDEVKIFNRVLSAAEISQQAGTRPDSYGFTPVTGAARSTPVESNSITISGTSQPATISIAGGEYDINGSNIWLATFSMINPGASVKVRLTSSASFATTTTATLTIGGVSGTFSVTTLADTEKPVVKVFTLHTAVSSAMSVSVDTFTATDNDRVSGYLVTDTATPPAADDPGWSAMALPMTVTLNIAGNNTLYAWAKDPAGNVSDALTATVLLKPVRREPENDYVSLQTAYGEAGSDETIKVLAVTLPENIDLNQQRDISISGGYEDGYGNQNGFTTIQGTLTVGTGSIKVERVILK
jgi:hypothetical protein